ncbi:MAG TPA: trypsin-like peptidase domain-containing protein, partial [Mobilitalea sp.]|nr:trypsin-like peptidase domain-containing protein [Mobilitalea sp.]
QVSQPAQDSGSGIIIGQNDSQILIVTNNHVIQDSTDVEVTFSDNTTAKATIKGADANTDLAVLSINKKELSDKTASTIKIATLGDSNNVKPGEMAIAIGNALGYGQSVTVGYISALNREVTISNNTMKLLQTDAAINPGNSGGALLNTAGQVIGINSVKYASSDVEGMGYAIPISTAIPMINELMNRQTVSKSEQGYLGIDSSTAQNVTDVTAQSFNMPVGVYVNDVVKGSPAEKAGLKSGNIITGVDNTTIKTIDDLANALSYKKAGDTIALKISVLNNGQYTEKSLSVTLGARP